MRVALGIAAITALTSIGGPALAQSNAQNPVVQYPNVTRSPAGLGGSRYGSNEYLWFNGEKWWESALRAREMDEYRASEDARLVPSQLELARALDRGQFSSALASARTLAAAGDPFAKRHLGWMYLHGAGVKRNARAAVELLREAAFLGDDPSALLLASVYRGRYGVPRDRKEARFWVARAAASSNPIIRNEAKRLRYRG